jgi:plasmid maintenance system antidote protein VapI
MPTGPKTRIAPASLGGELLVAWMTREKVSQRALARYLEWPLPRVHRILTGRSLLTVVEAVQVDDLTKGEVSVRSWTYLPAGATFRSVTNEKEVRPKGAP